MSNFGQRPDEHVDHPGDHEEHPPLTARERARMWARLLSYGGMMALSMAVLQFLVYNSVTGTWTEAARVDRVAKSDRPEVLADTEQRKDSTVLAPSGYGGHMSLAQLRDAARNGDARAQNRLGERYALGDGVPRDDKEAARWFRRAALRGLARAQYNLASRFRDARGVSRDPAQAVFWYLRAAKQQHSRAQYDLARLYELGIGVPRDQSNAVKWLLAAARSGLADAQFALGERYVAGEGVRPSKVTALEWYRKAALQDHQEARARFRELIAAGVVPDRAALRQAAPRRGRESPDLRKARIGEIQRLLARLNFKPGATDGRLDKGTRQAIRLYQQLAGRKVDGEPSPELLEELRAAAGTVGGTGG